MLRTTTLFSTLLLVFIAFSQVIAQDHHSDEHAVEQDTSIHSLKAFFRKGKVHGHVRSYFMATQNQGALEDYWTNATGGALKYQTASWKGLQFGLKGIFSYKTISDDLNRLDSLTQKSAKWEKELYDVNRPEEGHDLDRLEELYVKYNFSKSWFMLGKIDINKGPFFLRRDGRMKPFLYKGAWANIEDWKGYRIDLGWITGVAPRGMTEWYSINEAIGINNNGFEPDGHAAHYHETAETKGVGVLGLSSDWKHKVQFQYWNVLLHHITDINWWQVEYKHRSFFIGGQLVYQVPMGYQKKLAYADRYIQPDERGMVVSIKTAYQNKQQNVKWAFAYLHAFANGRFLFPRELGRENFYVSHPRSWIDGLGKTDVFMGQFSFTPYDKRLRNFQLDTKIGRINTSKPGEMTFNKYNQVSFWQATIDVRYSFSKFFEGLNLHLLYIGRYTADTSSLSAKDIFYRTNLHHFNFIANVNF